MCADHTTRHGLDVVFFDFGGVIAEEGFVNGLHALENRFGIASGELLAHATDICYNGGYVNGKMTEAGFWHELRRRTGIEAPDEELREAILSRFLIRLYMLDAVNAVRCAGIRAVIASDQTNWLEELDAAHRIYAQFDLVFNSYRVGMNKRSTDFFDFICQRTGVRPDRALFIDDNAGHIGRAASRGLNTLLYTSYEAFYKGLTAHIPELRLEACAR
ncbi:Haloacid dehalogenase domain protein hydrolase [Oleidesulfovibrio alaskensis G20]|uniref:Haloacid dehalogenase domain protein hydrolase n=1 Tax=Oleidesulfovibrio alaskensis (strain ATCC BAA-1058 / DSM 17464 / G20) TaxID=207559 RepID=Q30WD7_OLEA2|nr:HAD family phosphatase [Oleidesulfovibrio alaskensis]ABB40009.1 Haloacid dehalogenase domain protein hydrolase [Oleidesulfovibrio alaskensis G20]MBG0773312.1 HAD family phosphatase [Oleidesulfovibrio alaskensis]